jgi:hypothetical protein
MTKARNSSVSEGRLKGGAAAAEDIRNEDYNAEPQAAR